MELKYKLVFTTGKTLKEVALKDSDQVIIAGTDSDARARFRKALFYEPFSLRLTKGDGNWLAETTENCYLSFGDAKKRMALELSPGKEAQEYLYLSKDKLSADIGVAVMQGGKTVVHNLLNGGEKWFEVKKEFEFMPGEDGKMPIVITPLADKRQRIVPVILPTIVNRDIKSLKFRCLLRMKSANELVVEVEDAGLGEFFAPTNKRYQEIISLV